MPNTKTRANMPLLDKLGPAPLLGPKTGADWIKATLAAIKRPGASEQEREESRTLLALQPDLFETSGDLARMAQRERRGPLAKNA